MKGTIAHPPLPAPAGHTFPSILEALAKVVCHGHIYSLPQSDPVYGSTVPLYTAQQMREYRDAPAWLPIETAPKTSKAQLVWVPDNHCVFLVCWDLWGVPGWVHFGRDSVSDRLAMATHCMPVPAAPIEQAGGEQP